MGEDPGYSYPLRDPIILDSMGEKDHRPALSYSGMIAEAIRSSEDGQLLLSDIYEYIKRHYPYFKSASSGWKNSVRHNLSMNRAFKKLPAQPGRRKGNYWTISMNADIRLLNGRLMTKSRTPPKTRPRSASLPELVTYLEASSHPKLILPKLHRPVPQEIYSVAEFNDMPVSNTPPWMLDPSRNSSSRSNSSNLKTSSGNKGRSSSEDSGVLPSQLELFRLMDKDVTPPFILPKLPFAVNPVLWNPSPPKGSPNTRKKLRSDPLLTQSFFEL